MLKKEVQRRVKGLDSKMPFQESPTLKQPRSMKDRQQAWVLAGLKHIRAPLAPCFMYQSCV